MIDISNFGIVAGHPRLKEVTTGSGGGGNTTVELKPPANTIWIPTLIMAYHDDAARVMDWCLFETSGAILFGESTATSVYRYFYKDCPMAHPLVLTFEDYIYMLVIGMAASKNVFLKAWVHEIKGVPTI